MMHVFGGIWNRFFIFILYFFFFFFMDFIWAGFKYINRNKTVGNCLGRFRPELND